MNERTYSLFALLALILATAGCPSGNPCDDDFDVRCEGNTAVNCSQHCGFGPCENEIRRDDCNQSCSVVSAEDEANDAPMNVATEQIAACSTWQSAGSADPDAGSGDAGETSTSNDASTGDTGGE